MATLLQSEIQRWNQVIDQAGIPASEPPQRRNASHRHELPRPGPGHHPPAAPNPSRPAFALPANACDAHCHVFGPGDKFPYSGKRTYTPPDAPAERLRALHEMLGIARVVLVQASVHGQDNSAMLDAIAQSPDTTAAWPWWRPASATRN
jgi:hypothetical protein